MKNINVTVQPTMFSYEQSGTLLFSNKKQMNLWIIWFSSDENELNDCQVDENTKKILVNNIRRRLTPQAVKCRADVEVACYGYEGVDAVKAALREGLSASTEEMPVKVIILFEIN